MNGSAKKAVIHLNKNQTHRSIYIYYHTGINNARFKNIPY
jgi:hypothetical protein